MPTLDLLHPDILLGLGRSVGLLTLVSVLYTVLLRWPAPHPLVRQAVSGLLFGAAGVLSMLDPITIAPGVIADARSVIAGLAAPFGGPVAGMVTAVAVGAYRWWLGGIGAPAGVLGVALAACTGLAFRVAISRRGIRVKVRHLVLLGLLVGPFNLSGTWLLLPHDMAWRVINDVGVPLLLTSLVGITLLGTLLLREEQRVEGEAALRAGEARYRLIAEGVSDVIMKADLDGVRTYCSESVRDVFGYEPHELVGQRMDGIVHPDDHARTRDAFARLLTRKAARVTETARVRHKDGRLAWAEFTARLLSDPANGEPREVVAVVRDVTERQEIRDHLRLANERTRRLVDSNVIGVVVGDDRGDVLEANDYYLGMLGFTRADLEAGRVRWADLTPPEHLPADLRAIDEVRARGTCGPYEKQYLRRDGSRVWVQLGCARVPGSDDQTIAFVLDISDRKAAEQARIAAEGRIGLAMQAASIKFWTWDITTGRVAWIVPGPGGGLEEHPLGTFHECMAAVHPDDREAVRLAFLNAAAGEGQYAAEFRFLGTDGAVQWLSGVGMVERDAAGRPVRMVGVNVDMTARKAVETALAQAKETADTANAAKGRFLASLSHELRTPLTAIIGFSDMISKQALGPVGDSQYVQFGTDIRDSGQHLLELINEILDHAKAEAGHLALQEETVDLAAAVAFCTRMLAPRAGRAGVRLEPCVDEDARYVRADEKRVRQILLNLVSNAVKYTPTDGRVAVTVRLEGGAPTIRVSDTGIGIEEKDLGRVLEAFVQVKNQANRQSVGTGLGLPLTRKLVELHGGELTLGSRPGKGTTITIRLPEERLAAAPGPAPAHAAPSAEARRRTILVADDDPLIRLGAAAILEGYGYDAVQAANANEALAVLRDGTPIDLLFTDVVMPPGMNGAELAAHVVRMRPDIKVLLTSGFGAHAVVAEDGLEQGWQLLAKPYAPAELKRRVEDLFGAAPPSAAPRRAPGPHRILLAEDVPMNQTLIVSLLRKAGHAVDLATNGAEAVEAVGRGGYDLVLMDVQMPVMDGFEAVRRIRSLPGDAAATPIVALTADVQPEVIEECLAAGMDSYAAKPIEREVLLAAVDRWARAAAGVGA